MCTQFTEDSYLSGEGMKERIFIQRPLVWAFRQWSSCHGWMGVWRVKEWGGWSTTGRLPWKCWAGDRWGQHHSGRVEEVAWSGRKRDFRGKGEEKRLCQDNVVAGMHIEETQCPLKNMGIFLRTGAEAIHFDPKTLLKQKITGRAKAFHKSLAGYFVQAWLCQGEK